MLPIEGSEAFDPRLLRQCDKISVHKVDLVRYKDLKGSKNNPRFDHDNIRSMAERFQSRCDIASIHLIETSEHPPQFRHHETWHDEPDTAFGRLFKQALSTLVLSRLVRLQQAQDYVSVEQNVVSHGETHGLSVGPPSLSPGAGPDQHESVP